MRISLAGAGATGKHLVTCAMLSTPALLGLPERTVTVIASVALTVGRQHVN